MEKMKETFRDRYVLILVVILLLALATRLPDLGARVMSHDEINHVYFAWLFSENGGYQHDPLSHGPLQFHLLALSYRILGDSDFTSRLPAALSGVLAIFLIWPFRRWMGRKGALAAAGLILVSPYMLYYSRYARNEIFVVVEVLLAVWAVFSYLETREEKWLFLLAAALALHYTTKETAFLFAAQLLLFLLVFFSLRVLRRTWSKPGMRTMYIAGLGTATIGLGLGMVIFLRDRATVVEVAVPYTSPLIYIFSAIGLAGVALSAVALILGVGRRLREDYPSLDLIIITGTLTLPQLGALPAQIMGWDPLAYTDSSQFIPTAIIVIILLALSFAAGLAWKPRTWLTAAGVFTVLFVPLYTTIFTKPYGLFSGLVGSMGYWLVQQGVERGSQPWYYYTFLQIPMYEYLPALGVLSAGGIALGKRFRQPARGRTVEEQGAEPSSQRTLLRIFLAYWVVTSLFIYTYAGERMPWLTVHIALPQILLAGWVFGEFIKSLDRKAICRWETFALLLLIPLAVVSFTRGAAHLFGTMPSTITSLPGVEKLTGWMVAFAIFAIAMYGVIHYMRRYNALQLSQIAAAVILALLFLQTARTALRAAFINYDSAKEFLVYAHAAPGPKQALEEIERLSLLTTGGDELEIAYDNDAAYPYWWYLRDYPNAYAFGETPSRDLLRYPVIVADTNKTGQIEAYLGDRYQAIEYSRIWWPNEDYRNLNWERIRGVLSSPEMMAALWDIWFDRDYRAYGTITDKNFSQKYWQPANRMKLYIRKDLAAQAAGLSLEDAGLDESMFIDPYAQGMVELTPERVIGSLGAAPGEFSGPRGVAVGDDGLIYVTDSDNHRVQVLEQDGTPIREWGSFGDVSTANLPANAFNQPWGITLAEDGTVVIADTWNHRVQFYSPTGDFLDSLGSLDAAESLESFWGPRSLAFNSQGDLFISDTGNKRILVFNEEIQPLAEIGGAGLIPGKLDEPVGITVGPDDHIYIVDTWNQRVQVFEETEPGLFAYVHEWPVDAWYGQSLDNKPYIAASPAGQICVSDPEAIRILCFSPEGEFLTGWSGSGMTRPVGITFDSECKLWVADSAANTILQFDPGLCR